MLDVRAAAAALSLLVAQWAAAFTVVKVVGAAYLVYLGVRLLLRKQTQAQGPSVSPHGARRALVEGVVVEALNVKTAPFFLAFLLQFVAPGEPMVPKAVLLVSICVALNTLVDVMAVLGAHRLQTSGVALAARARLMTRVSGITMIGLGVFLAAEVRQAWWVAPHKARPSRRMAPPVPCPTGLPTQGA